MRVTFIVISLFVSNIFCDHRGPRCPRYYSPCTDGGCIPSTSICDGKPDCSDGSDETFALCMEYAPLCPPYAFRCAYGACVENTSICNGIKDCADRSDELLPQCSRSNSIVKKCKIYEFQCDSGQCINEILICDGNSDCIDGSDETITQCTNFICPPYGFQCAYGGCISKIKKCDHRKDCKDGSDENTELCTRNAIETISTTTKPITKPKLSYSCRLPEIPVNGNYEVADCKTDDSSAKCRKIPDTVVGLNTVLRYSCYHGYVLSSESDSTFCTSGSWDPEPPSCQKKCEGLHPYTLQLECSYLGNKVKCGQPMRPGTVIKANCSESYHPRELSYSSVTPKCLTDGTWNIKPVNNQCVPDCGFRNKVYNIKPLIANGTKVHLNEYPWHAGFYLVKEENIVYSCGGTIIHPRAILTAAHCVFDDDTNNLRDQTKMRVAVGKYWSDWNHKDDLTTEQKFNVIEVYLGEKYRGKAGRYDHDIAILKLDRLIILKPIIMPVCLDKGYTFRLDQRLDAIGTVVGSGAIKPFGDASKELRVAWFSVRDFYSCFEKATITSDKFCTGSSNESSSLQEGDSGSGITFHTISEGYERYFIYGIVSSKKRTLNNEVDIFTNVTFHREWIDRVLKRIETELMEFIPI